jgi:hypothetical protein
MTPYGPPPASHIRFPYYRVTGAERPLSPVKQARRAFRGVGLCRTETEAHPPAAGTLRNQSDVRTRPEAARDAARNVIPAADFASPYSTRARAAIIGSRGWSGWWWRGSEAKTGLGRKEKGSKRAYVGCLTLKSGLTEPLTSELGKTRSIVIHLLD